MKKRIGLGVLAFVLLLAACSGKKDSSASTASSAAQVYKSNIVTNQPGQSWMLIGNTLAEWGKGTIELSVEPGSTYGNVLAVNSGESKYGVTAQTAISSALAGVRYYQQYGPQTNLRFVASFFRHYLRGITLKPEIKTLADLKGRSVCFGPAGGESHDYGRLVLSYYGLQEGDYTVKVMPFADATEAMKNNQLDMILNCSPVPYAMFDDAAMGNPNAHNVGVSEELAKRLSSEWKGFDYVEYDFEDRYAYTKPFYSPYQQVTLIAHKDVSDDEVYIMTKLVYDHFEDLGNVVSNFKQMSGIEMLADNPVNIPMHPGAEKFYKEVDLMK
jgi:TRAP transporter TAXI family solute receptor